MPELNDYPANENDSIEERLQKALGLIAHQRLCLRFVKRKLEEHYGRLFVSEPSIAEEVQELIDRIDEAL